MIALQFLACFCNILACVTDNQAIDQAADLVDLIADIVWCAVCGCMQVRCLWAVLSAPGCTSTERSCGCLRDVCVCVVCCTCVESRPWCLSRPPALHIAAGWWLERPKGELGEVCRSPGGPALHVMALCMPQYFACHPALRAVTVAVCADTSQD